MSFGGIGGLASVLPSFPSNFEEENLPQLLLHCLQHESKGEVLGILDLFVGSGQLVFFWRVKVLIPPLPPLCKTRRYAQPHLPSFLRP